MLHPGYPTLMVAVHEYLERHPDMCVLAIIDRETVVAATKFVLCRTDWFKRYEEKLLEAYKAQRLAHGRRLRAALVPGAVARYPAGRNSRELRTRRIAAVQAATLGRRCRLELSGSPPRYDRPVRLDGAGLHVWRRR